MYLVVSFDNNTKEFHNRTYNTTPKDEAVGYIKSKEKEIIINIIDL